MGQFVPWCLNFTWQAHSRSERVKRISLSSSNIMNQVYVCDGRWCNIIFKDFHSIFVDLLLLALHQPFSDPAVHTVYHLASLHTCIHLTVQTTQWFSERCSLTEVIPAPNVQQSVIATVTCALWWQLDCFHKPGVDSLSLSLTLLLGDGFQWTGWFEYPFDACQETQTLLKYILYRHIMLGAEEIVLTTGWYSHRQKHVTILWQNWVFVILGALAQSRKANTGFVMSVCPPVEKNSATNGRIFMKIDIWVYSESMSRKLRYIKIWK